MKLHGEILFLSGSNNEPLPKNGRDFVASMTSLKDNGNFKNRDVSLDTVMGVLSCLIGDQRKLYQARSSDKYYFSDMENQVSFVDKPNVINNEVVYIRNIIGSTDQNSFTGMIIADHKALTSVQSNMFWGVLWLSVNEVISFIQEKSFVVHLPSHISLDPFVIGNRSEFLNKEKPLTITDEINVAITQLEKYFPDQSYIEVSGKAKLIRLYAGALYIQLQRLSDRFDMSSFCNGRDEKKFIFGYSKRGFNGFRDFMKNFTTGKEKLIWGNPYLLKKPVKGQGEVSYVLSKASGSLDILIDISRENAKELQTLIENAGVASFYLGKKGLAYVDNVYFQERAI